MYGFCVKFHHDSLILPYRDPMSFRRVGTFRSAWNTSQKVLTWKGHRGFTKEAGFLNTESVCKMHCSPSREVKRTQVCSILISTLILSFLHDLRPLLNLPWFLFLFICEMEMKILSLKVIQWELNNGLKLFESVKWCLLLASVKCYTIQYLGET